MSSVSGPCPLLTAWPRVGCGSIGDGQEEKEVDYDMKAVSIGRVE